MDLTAHQYSDQVALAQTGKEIDERGRLTLQALERYNLPAQLANTGLVFSLDEDNRMQAVVHGKTFVASCDHLLATDKFPIPKLLGRIRFIEKDSKDENALGATILYDDLGNAGIYREDDPSNFYLGRSLNTQADLDELFRKIGIQIVGLAQAQLTRIDLM